MVKKFQFGRVVATFVTKRFERLQVRKTKTQGLNVTRIDESIVNINSWYLFYFKIMLK